MSNSYDDGSLPIGKIVGLVILVVLVATALGWVSDANDLMKYKFFGPKTEAVRRDVFEQTKSYNQGMIQELQNMQFEYVKADEEHKAALADIILHRAADYNMDDSRVPSDLRSFVAKLRRERTEAR